MDLKSAIGRASLLALLACGGGSLQGCAGEGSRDPSGSEDRNLGELSMHLELSEGATVSSVSYEISGNGFFKAGTVDVTQTSQIAFQVYGIPAGEGYTITLQAGGASDGFSCVGAATFSITAGEISEAHVPLQCEIADGTGGVSVDGTTNVCPTLADLTALPSSVSVGGTIQLSALAEDRDHRPQAISYAWTSTLGSLSGEDSANASLACTGVGAGNVTLTYSDGECSREISLPVSCTRLSIASSPAVLSAGTNHACRLRTDGRAVCWGGNTGWGLGFETMEDVAANPQQTASFVDTRALPRGLEATWKSISVGERHTCGITSSGAGYCWGSSESGELGDALNQSATTPRPIDTSLLPPDTTWSMLTAGGGFTCGITAGGTGYCWGSDGSGQLGNGALASQLTPSPIDTSALPPGTSWSALSAGSDHACGITTDGTAYCWGFDGNGKLGNGPALTALQASPTAVELATLPSGTTWATISAGYSHTCGVTTAGELYCWGSDEAGKLGDGNPTVTDQDHPSLVSPGALRSGSRWTWVSTGRTHTCGLSTDRAVYCWGPAGTIGNGTQASPSPMAVDVSRLPAGTEWATVDASESYSCGLTMNGASYCWGSDGDGRLGNGSSISSETAPNSPVVTTINVVGVSVALLPSAFVRMLTGAVGDPTNPVLSFSLIPMDTAAEDLVVTVQSSDETVVPPANVTVSGEGTERVASIAPAGAGTTRLTFVVSDPAGNQTALLIDYAGSGAAPDASGRYHMGISNASTAIDVGDGYMVVADDETNLLYLYRQDESGYPVKSWDYTGATLLGTRERDIEGGARVGDLIVWTGSQGNARDGAIKEYRRTIFATRIIGSGADVELEFAGRYGGGGNKDAQAIIGLWTDLRNWDQTNGHGLGANFLRFVTASQTRVLPNAPNGFNVEGFEFAANGTTGYLGFRAPTININGTQHALIVPVTNILDLVNGIPTQQVGLARFGAPLFLDLAGRSIRELRRNEFGEYLISAGPPDNPTVGVNDTWALYVWDGDPTHAPVLNRLLPTPNLRTDGVWEGIVSAPHPLASGAEVRFITDSGDTIFYGESATFGDPKFYNQIITLE